MLRAEITNLFEGEIARSVRAALLSLFWGLAMLQFCRVALVGPALVLVISGGNVFGESGLDPLVARARISSPAAGISRDPLAASSSLPPEMVGAGRVREMGQMILVTPAAISELIAMPKIVEQGPTVVSRSMAKVSDHPTP